jgi:retinol dehydrogenase-13
MENTMAAELIPAVIKENQGLFGALALGGLVLAGLGIRAYRKWIAGGVCTSQARLDGKTVIITGANSGIGLETAVDIAKRNARVILACRSVERGEAALADVKKRSGNNNVVFVQLDLGSLASVRAFAAKILEDEPRIDILINNAGVMMVPKRTLTSDGFEMQFGVNHLSHFLLTNLLLDRIKETPSARIVNLSSSVQGYAGKFEFDNLNSERSYGPVTAYCASKLANILFTRSLAKRLESTGVTTNAVDPGAIRTGLQQHLTFPMVSFMCIIV